MLIEKLGHDAGALVNTYLLHEGRPCRIRRVSYDSLQLIDVTDNSRFDVSPDILAGWRDLKYPRLGYRRLPNGVWGWTARGARSYSRGLNPDNTSFELSAWLRSNRRSAEGFLSDEAFEFLDGDIDLDDDGASDYVDQVMAGIFCPVWDGKDELTKLLSNKALCWIPSPRYLVERFASGKNFAVYVDKMLIGGLTPKGVAIGPENNLNTINRMLKNYAS